MEKKEQKEKKWWAYVKVIFKGKISISKILEGLLAFLNIWFNTANFSLVLCFQYMLLWSNVIILFASEEKHLPVQKHVDLIVSKHKKPSQSRGDIFNLNKLLIGRRGGKCTR